MVYSNAKVQITNEDISTHLETLGFKEVDSNVIKEELNLEREVSIEAPIAYKKNFKKTLCIANNPFDVFHSWMEYNTDINDAARIASRTVINLSENRPEDKDPFLWIGRKYAEDKNWGKGTRAVFEELMVVWSRVEVNTYNNREFI